MALAELQSGGEKTGGPSVTCPQQAKVKSGGRSGSGAEGKRSATASKAKAVRASLSDDWRRALRSSTASASTPTGFSLGACAPCPAQAEARRRTASKAPSCSRSPFPAPELKRIWTHAAVLLADRREAARLAVLVDGVGNPVDAGVAADGLVRGVDKDNLVVLQDSEAQSLVVSKPGSAPDLAAAAGHTL